MKTYRLPAALLLGLALLGAFTVARPVVVADFNLCYPYLTADSYDWITNGLYWAGASVQPSLRPPGLPLLMAGLWKLGALPLLPVLNLAFLGLSVVALYALLRERHDGWIAACACCFVFASGFVQEFSRSVMAETFAVPFLILAALAFVRAGRAPNAWIAFGLCLGAGFLFSYAAVPVTFGFAAALLVAARDDLRRREFWAGLFAYGVIAGSWLAYRWWYYRVHPGGPRHGVEALVRLSVSNAPAYFYAALALVGLVPFVLYVAGALRFTSAPSATPRWKAAVIFPLVALTLFWCFVYDWADKRFVLYSLPFLACFLAQGLETLRTFARTGRVAAVASAAFLALALFWNRIPYPSYGLEFLALSPVHFFQTGLTFTPAAKAVLHAGGARIARSEEGLGSLLSRAVTGVPATHSPCLVSDEAYSCLGVVKREADRLLPAGRPVGLLTTTPHGWPVDYWSSTQRLSNALLRPVSLPEKADLLFAGVEAAPPGFDFTRDFVVVKCGPYVLVRTR